MPIETERPGVFRGREWNTTSWYVVDPAAPDGIDAARSAWIRQTSSTNTPEWRRAVGPIAGLCVFAWGTWGLVAAMMAANVAIIGVFAAIAFVILLVVSIMVGASLASGKPGTNGGTEHVREVSSDVATAVSDDIDLADLWELNDHYSRMNEVLSRSRCLRTSTTRIDRATQSGRYCTSFARLLKPNWPVVSACSTRSPSASGLPFRRQSNGPSAAPAARSAE